MSLLLFLQALGICDFQCFINRLYFLFNFGTGFAYVYLQTESILINERGWGKIEFVGTHIIIPRTLFENSGVIKQRGWTIGKQGLFPCG